MCLDLHCFYGRIFNDKIKLEIILSPKKSAEKQSQGLYFLLHMRLMGVLVLYSPLAASSLVNPVKFHELLINKQAPALTLTPPLTPPSEFPGEILSFAWWVNLSDGADGCF